MTIEITVRLEDPMADVFAMLDGMRKTFDKDMDTKGMLRGGFYFTTERTPAAFFGWLATEGFEMTHFENIEFKPVS